MEHQSTSTPQDRSEVGRAIRSGVPRSSHADWTPAPDRPDPVDVLEASNVGRVEELVPIRYGRMAASPFAFFRGSAGLMAIDLAQTPVTGLRVQACGDAHVANFGEFATPGRTLVFDVNDFDETLPGPWEWDIKRLAASIELVVRLQTDSAGGARDAGGHGRSRVSGADGTLRGDARARRMELSHRGRRRHPPLPVALSALRAGQLRARPAADPHRGGSQADPLRAWSPAFRGAAARRRPAGQHRARPRGSARAVRGLPAVAGGGPTCVAGPVSTDGRGAEGGRPGERGHPLLGGALRGAPARLRRPAHPPDQGGWRVRAGAIRRQPGSATSRAPDRSRAAPDAVRQRHLPWLVRGASLGSPLLHPPAVEHEGQGRPPGARPCQPRLPRLPMRLGPRPRARPDRRPCRDRGVSRAWPRFDRAVVEFAARYGDQVERDHAVLVEAVAAGRVEARTGV